LRENQNCPLQDDERWPVEVRENNANEDDNPVC